MIAECPHCRISLEFDEETCAVMAGMHEVECPACGQMVPVGLILGWASGTTDQPQEQLPDRRKSRAKRLAATATGLLCAGLLLWHLMQPDAAATVSAGAVPAVPEDPSFYPSLLAGNLTTAAHLESLGGPISDGRGGHLAVSRHPMPWGVAAGFAGQLGATVLALPPEGAPGRITLLEHLEKGFPSMRGIPAWVTSREIPATLCLPDVLSAHARNHPRRVFVHWPAGGVDARGSGNSPEPGSQEEFVWIPPGKFPYGDSTGENRSLEVREVQISGFHVGRTELTNAKWNEIQGWAVNHGYSDLPRADGNSRYPVDASWYDALKWCNARSEMEGKTPCYYMDVSRKTTYRTGQVDVIHYMVMWDADGYRLPTEAEWEKAARGGTTGRRFPWGDTITHANANYSSSGAWTPDGKIPPYDVSPTRGNHPAYKELAPVASFPPNDFGLHDVAGNAWEWCWDVPGGRSSRHHDRLDNPVGECRFVDIRVRRGGSVGHSAMDCQVARPNGLWPAWAQGVRIVFR